MKTYGEHGSFPITYDSANEKVIYSFPSPILPIEYIDVSISEDGLTGFAGQRCEICDGPAPIRGVFLRKIVGSK